MENLIKMFNEVAFNDFAIGKNHSIKKENGSTILVLPVPGFSKEDLKITIENKELKIISEKENKLGYKINRSYLISSDIDDIKAKVEDGMLELNFIKKVVDKKIINIL